MREPREYDANFANPIEMSPTVATDLRGTDLAVLLPDSCQPWEF